MSDAIEFRLNGKPVRVDSVSPNTTLLEWLRSSGLTGSKEGCAEGDCGACSVAIVDRDARGKRCYRAIRDAAADAFGQRNGLDEFDAQLKAAKAKLKAARYNFDGETFLRPTSLDKLFRVLGEHPEARLIAGATDLGLEITKRFQRFLTLISLEAVGELNEISATETEWRIGAATT